MPDRFIPKGSKVITSVKRTAIRESVAVAASTSVVVLLKTMIWIPRLGIVTPLEWDVSYGVTTPITADETMEWFLTLVDIDNLPLIAGAADRAIWSAAQAWTRDTDVGKRQMLTREIQDFFNPASFSFTERADFTQRLGVALLALSSNAETFFTVGVITYQEELIQRKWGGDNATFDRDDGDWEDFASDEDDEDSD